MLRARGNVPDDGGLLHLDASYHSHDPGMRRSVARWQVCVTGSIRLLHRILCTRYYLYYPHHGQGNVNARRLFLLRLSTVAAALVSLGLLSTRGPVRLSFLQSRQELLIFFTRSHQSHIAARMGPWLQGDVHACWSISLIFLIYLLLALPCAPIDMILQVRSFLVRFGSSLVQSTTWYRAPLTPLFC